MNSNLKSKLLKAAALGAFPYLAHSWDLVKIYENNKHTVRNLCGGTVLYYENKVIKDVGGMRTMFGRYGGEHVNLSDRIYNRGWTSWRYTDVKESEKLFYELGRYDKSHKSAADKEDFDHNQKIGMQLYLFYYNYYLYNHKYNYKLNNNYQNKQLFYLFELRCFSYKYN